jgi:hypothetical protein
MGYYFDFMTNTLYMTHRFSMRANDITSDEFKAYEGLKEHFPMLRVVVAKPPKRNSKYIPYPKMIQYIALMDDGAKKLAEFNKVRQASTAQTNPTQFVNQWFKETFPNYGKPLKKAS